MSEERGKSGLRPENPGSGSGLFDHARRLASNWGKSPTPLSPFPDALKEVALQKPDMVDARGFRRAMVAVLPDERVGVLFSEKPTEVVSRHTRFILGEEGILEYSVRYVSFAGGFMDDEDVNEGDGETDLDRLSGVVLTGEVEE